MPFAAPRYRRSPRPPPRGSARRSAFPRPSRALHPRRPEPGREESGARRGRSSRRSAGRGIRRMAGRAPSWCPWDLGLGPPGDEIALGALLGLQLRLVLLHFFGQSLEGGQALGSWAATTWIGFQETLRPSLDWNTLAGFISISSPESLPASTVESQKVVLPYLSVSDSKTSAHPSSTPSSPCVAHTPQTVAWQQSSSVVASQQRNTTLGAVVARERQYPRTSHLRPLSMSATLPDRVRRVSSTSTRACCDFSAYGLYPATSWERRSISSA